jgi:hypothetical protein
MPIIARPVTDESPQVATSEPPEVLTIEEIEARYDSEWILVGDPEVDEDLRVLRGTVLYHSKDRDEMYRRDLELRPKSAAYLYTGQFPEDAVIVL